MGVGVGVGGPTCVYDIKTQGVCMQKYTACKAPATPKHRQCPMRLFFFSMRLCFLFCFVFLWGYVLFCFFYEAMFFCFFFYEAMFFFVCEAMLFLVILAIVPVTRYLQNVTDDVLHGTWQAEISTVEKLPHTLPNMKSIHLRLLALTCRYGGQTALVLPQQCDHPSTRKKGGQIKAVSCHFNSFFHALVTKVRSLYINYNEWRVGAGGLLVRDVVWRSGRGTGRGRCRPIVLLFFGAL